VSNNQCCEVSDCEIAPRDNQLREAKSSKGTSQCIGFAELTCFFAFQSQPKEDPISWSPVSLAVRFEASLRLTAANPRESLSLDNSTPLDLKVPFAWRIQKQQQTNGH